MSPDVTHREPPRPKNGCVTHERLEGNVSKKGEETNAYFNRVGLSEAKVHNFLDLMPTLLEYVLVTCAYLLI